MNQALLNRLRAVSETSSPYKAVDVVVAGGGPSGIAAALAAARQGARTLLVERFGRIGGAGVTSAVSPLMGSVDSPIVREILEAFSRADENWEMLDLVYYDMLEAAGVELLLHSAVVGPILDGDRVCGIRILCKEGLLDVHAGCVVDATADGDVAYGAGAPYEKGRERDGLLQPMTIMFRLDGVDKTRALICKSEEEAETIEVPEGTWAAVCRHGASSGELDPKITVIRVYESRRKGERIVNATQVNYVDGTKIADITQAEIQGRRQALVVRDFLRRHAPGYETCEISHMPAAIGVRETRRFLGERYLTLDDLMQGRKWPDAVVYDAFFPIDIHNPDGGGQSEGRAAQPKGYDIPYGCLVPRTIDGLVLAGRCISGSHEAHASYRVQKICMAIGAAAGVAAALAVRSAQAPRDLAVSDIQAALAHSS